MASSDDVTDSSEASSASISRASTPSYMRATTSSSARKGSFKKRSGTRLSSSESKSRIYATNSKIHKVSMDECLDSEGVNIPPEDITPEKSLLRVPELITPLSHVGIDRATCSSTLRKSEFQDNIKHLTGRQESEGTSSVHVCCYRYCSLHGHQNNHHAPSPPLREFISAKRQLLSDGKDKQPREDAEHSTSATKRNSSRLFIENHTAQEVDCTRKGVNVDSLVTTRVKPRKNWSVVGNPSNDSSVFIGFTDKQTGVTVTPSKELQPTKERQEALKKDVQEPVLKERDEAVKLVQDTINELLNLSEHTVDHQVLQNGREISSPEAKTTETEILMDIISTLQADSASLGGNVFNANSKLSKVMTSKPFIEALNKMRQLTLRSPQKNCCTTPPEVEGFPPLHQTTAEEKSWQEWMLDHLLQQAVARLASAQKRRVTLLVQAFETVGSQSKPTAEQSGKAEIS